MDINYVIAFLQHAKEQGLERVMFDRDLVPVAEIDLEIVGHEHPRGPIVVVKEVQDQFSPIQNAPRRISWEELARRKAVDDGFAILVREDSVTKEVAVAYIEDVRNRV